MDRRNFLGASAAVACWGLAGCTGYETTSNGNGNAAMGDSDGNTVTMASIAFEPRSLSVDPGATVTWANEGSVAHTVEAATFTEDGTEWSFESGRVEPGESTTHTFESAGAYEYRCTIHGESTMCGVVIVGDASHSAGLPCESGGGGGGY